MSSLFRWPALEQTYAQTSADLQVFRGVGPWGVSTLRMNPVTKSPMTTRFSREADALDYARLRAAVTGSPHRAKDGRVLYVLLLQTSGEWDIQYRVLRGERGLRTRAGFPDDRKRQEQILVFRNDGPLPNGRTHWVLDRSQTIDVDDPDVERDKARALRGTKRMTFFDRYGDPEG